MDREAYREFLVSDKKLLSVMALVAAILDGAAIGMLVSCIRHDGSVELQVITGFITLVLSAFLFLFVLAKSSRQREIDELDA